MTTPAFPRTPPWQLNRLALRLMAHHTEVDENDLAMETRMPTRLRVARVV